MDLKKKSRQQYRASLTLKLGKNTECLDCHAIGKLQRHHIDGDRDNNSKNNLVPLCSKCHDVRHKEAGTGKYSKNKNKLSMSPNIKYNVSGRHVAQSRYVLGDETCNRCDKKADERHHIDRDCKNNSNENIELLCFRCHDIEHGSITDEQVNDILKMFEYGVPRKEIQERLSLNKHAVNKAIREKYGVFKNYKSNHDEVIRLKGEGFMNKDIAEKLNLGCSTVSEILARNGIRTNKKRKSLNALEKEQIFKLRKQGYSLKKIADKYDVGRSTISRSLKKEV